MDTDLMKLKRIFNSFGISYTETELHDYAIVLEIECISGYCYFDFDPSTGKYIKFSVGD